MEIGLGRLRFSPSAFYDLTLEELTAAAAGDSQAEELRQQMEWERTRWLACCLLQPHAKRGSSLAPRNLATFPWEVKKAPDKASEKRAANILKSWIDG